MTLILSFISVNSSTANASPGPYSSSLHVVSFLSNWSVFSFTNSSLLKIQIKILQFSSVINIYKPRCISYIFKLLLINNIQ